MKLRKNLINVFRSSLWVIGFILWVIIIAMPSLYFIQKELIIWNLGYIFFITEVSLTILISILFWLFLWSTFYKIEYFKIKKTGIWFFWWFLWVLVSGCPACSITLASYIWLASIISALPYYWLELKVLSLGMLLYANYATLNNLELCKIKVKPKI